MPRNLNITKLFVGVVAVVSFTCEATASASVRSCSYRNSVYGSVPYVARVTTNLTSAAVGGANVCDVVSAAVTQVQRRGYGLGAAPLFVRADMHWALTHHLVYPRGWPHPNGPVYDPHMHVTLRMISQQQAHATGAERSRRTPYWIKLNEYT